MSATVAERHGTITEAGTIVFERLLPGPIERVWEYLTDSEKRGLWLAGGPMEPRVGGRVQLSFRNTELSPIKAPPPQKYVDADCSSVKGEVTLWEKPYRLAYLWGDGGSEVTFELVPDGARVRLTLTHRRLAGRAMMVSVAGGWHTHLGILADQLSGETPRPFWPSHTALERDYDQRIAR
jgi:uncharacterized protein YndB with AHSA1/START domain